VTWAPASAGVTFVVLDARATHVIPAEAGTQYTAQRVSCGRSSASCDIIET